MRCAFCELPEIKKRKIAENKLAWAFPTNIPITISHTLIAPKQCVSKFKDLTSKEIKAIFSLMKKLKTAIKKPIMLKAFMPHGMKTKQQVKMFLIFTCT